MSTILKVAQKTWLALKMQITQINLVFSISTTLSPAFTFFSGMLIDKHGIWFGRTVFLLQISAGFVLIGVSKFTEHYLIFNVGNTALVTVDTSMEKPRLFFNFHKPYQRMQHLLTSCTFSTRCTLSSTLVFRAYSSERLTIVNHVQTFALTLRCRVDENKLSFYGY